RRLSGACGPGHTGWPPSGEPRADLNTPRPGSRASVVALLVVFSGAAPGGEKAPASSSRVATIPRRDHAAGGPFVSVKRNVITGAPGLLGSHVAEALVARGECVRAIVRPSSDTAHLRSLGVELVEGDLDKPPSLPRAVEGADVVYHCAARVGDWGP